MSEQETKTHDEFILPTSVVSKLDLSRMVAEAEQIDNELTAASVRAKTGSRSRVNPVMSTQLKDFLDQNELSFRLSRERTKLVKQLRLLKDKVPVVHMTFAVVADYESLQKIAEWLRSSIHPQAVIEVGIQPRLIAGVHMRTPNHLHDMTLRHAFDGRRDVLFKELEALRGKR